MPYISSTNLALIPDITFLMFKSYMAGMFPRLQNADPSGNFADFVIVQLFQANSQRLKNSRSHSFRSRNRQDHDSLIQKGKLRGLLAPETFVFQNKLETADFLIDGLTSLMENYQL